LHIRADSVDEDIELATPALTPLRGHVVHLPAVADVDNQPECVRAAPVASAPRWPGQGLGVTAR
jgi:hypothetical protein